MNAGLEQENIEKQEIILKQSDQIRQSEAEIQELIAKIARFQEANERLKRD